MNKREKVVAVMQENPDWHLPRVASQVGCSESYVHLVRKQIKAAEYQTLLVVTVASSLVSNARRGRTNRQHCSRRT